MMSDLFDKLFQVDTVEEASAKQLMRKQKSITRLFPEFPDRVKAVADKGGIRLENVEDELWHFKIHSGTKDSVWYDDYIQFKDVLGTLADVVKDRRLWVKDKSRIDRRKMARAFMNKVDIQLQCSCPADKYYGGQYIRSLDKYGAKQGDPEKRSPKVRNPKQYGAYCKHLQNLMKVLPFYNDTMMRWLEDFYGDEIRTFEEETKKEYGWMTKAAKTLAKRVEPVVKEPVVKEPVVKEPVVKEPVVKEPTATRQRVRKEEPEVKEPVEKEVVAPIVKKKDKKEEPEVEEPEVEEPTIKRKAKKEEPEEDVQEEEPTIKKVEPKEKDPEEEDPEEEQKKREKEDRMARRKKDRDERNAGKKKKTEEDEEEEEEPE